MTDIEIEESIRGTLQSWQTVFRKPVYCRVGNTKRFQFQFVILIALLVVYLIIFFYSFVVALSVPFYDCSRERKMKPYNSTYPFTKPVLENDTVTFTIGLISDLDMESKSKDDENTFVSKLKRGFLIYHKFNDYAMISWDQQPATMLTSGYSNNGRGMELSELIVFDGRLLTFDDRSGIVFEILNDKVIPWAILADGDGRSDKGFKAEWATVKDEVLYVGSTGKEMTTAAGEFLNDDPMWIKTLSTRGEVQHINWMNNYNAMNEALGIRWPGYVFHESGVWSSITKKWHFLPRKCSKEVYNTTLDEVRGCNFLVTADKDFSNLVTQKIGRLEPKLGFSSFKFIPGTNHEAIVALKTTEFKGETSTYIMVFKTNGKVLIEDSFIGTEKYEGIEFL